MLYFSWFTGCMMGILFFFSLEAEEKQLPEKMLKIMQQNKYQHANWGILAKDSETGEVLYELNSDKLFIPASTTKLFSVAALLHVYGDNYRFKTPVYASGPIKNGVLEGNLILVAQGDLTMGGRQDDSEVITFTKMDHIYSNTIPEAILTKQDPLYGLTQLAKQVHEKGIKQIDGDVLIDDRLFQNTEKRGMILSPIMINENLIDLVINPTEVNKTADFSWRPKVPGYVIKNEIKTVSKDEPLDIQITSDELGRNIVVKGTIPAGQKDILRTFSVKNPTHFARAAFIQALEAQGITVNIDEKKGAQLPSLNSLHNMQPIAVWTSPPLSEYAKLILKVSHNLGADLVPLLLAVRTGGRTFEEGMGDLGKFVIDKVKISSDHFVFVDAAGGDGNRLSPKAEVQLLDYIKKLPADQFQKFYNALPILGVDGSLEDFGKGTEAVGKVHAKTGTGVSFNLATNEFFLITQALAGYIDGKNGHLIEFMIVVNNAQSPLIADIFPIFEDEGQMTGVIYDLTH